MSPIEQLKNLDLKKESPLPWKVGEAGQILDAEGYLVGHVSGVDGTFIVFLANRFWSMITDAERRGYAEGFAEGVQSVPFPDGVGGAYSGG